MEACLVVALLWLLFGGTHMGLAAARVRTSLVARLGEGGYTALFSVVAAILFTLLLTYYLGHRFEGPPGPGLGRFPLTRGLLMGVIGAGFVLVAGGLAGYPRSPMALFSAGEGAREPRGFERVTRHGFFAGVVLFAAAHALLSTRLVSVVFCAGLALLPILGARHQDARLLVRRGSSYADYLAATSFVPFAAVRDGRQRIVWSELPWLWLAAALLASVVLRQIHTAALAHGGLWIVATVLGGAAFASFQAWRARRRSPAPAVAEPVP